MADYTREVKKRLSANGCRFVRYGKGDHEIWHSPVTKRNFTVDGSITKRSSANETLKSAGFQIIATALENAVDINTVKFGGKVALIIGSEANGVSDELLALSDIRVKIPMQSDAESLNAAVAAGIAMWEINS